MNKKKRIAILFAVIIVVAVGIIIAVTSHQKKEKDFEEFDVPILTPSELLQQLS